MGANARGQAAVDYVAVLAVVVVVFGGAATVVAAPWLPSRVAAEIRHGICLVSGSLCTPEEARRAGLAPCAVRARSNAERIGGTVTIIRLDRDDVLAVERRSDGTVAVSFVDGVRGGGELAVGLRLPVGKANLSAGAGGSFHAGRTYVLDNWPAAQRFLHRFAREETLTGEARRAFRRICWSCPEWLEGRDRNLPPASATYVEGGAWTQVAAALKLDVPVRGATLPLGLDAELAGSAVMGRRIAGPRTTWYIRLGQSAVAQAGTLLASLSARRDAEVVLEVTEEGGREVEARLTTAVDAGGEGELAGASLDIADVVRWVQGAPAERKGGDEGGVRLDASVALDLTDEANRRALAGVLRIPSSSPLGWAERVRAFGRRLDVAGEVDLSVSRTMRSGSEKGVGGLGLTGRYSRVEQTRDLLAAWSLAPGDRLRRREDCEAAAVAAGA